MENILKGSLEFRYQMLGRMKADCDYFLGLGNRCEERLWSKDVKKQIANMTALYNSFSDTEKPNGISMRDIKMYEYLMTSNGRVFVEEADSTGKYKGWCYREKSVVEEATGKQFTLTQPVDIFNEDTYGVRRCIACENVPVNIVPEKDFYVYEVTYMPHGYCCRTEMVSEDIFCMLMKEHLLEFLRGDARESIQKFFEGASTKEIEDVNLTRDISIMSAEELCNYREDLKKC